VSGAGPLAGQQSFQSGWYGKIPTVGDFVARRIPGAFSHAWGEWLQGALAAARARPGSRWPDEFLCMPAWRFVLAPGLLTRSAWAGIMAPSVDAVGRYFPLALASALPPARLNLVATLFAARAWFDELEQAALSAIAAGAGLAELDASVAAQPFCEAWLRAGERPAPERVAPQPITCLELAGRPGAAARAVWLAEDSEIFGRTLLLCDQLPPAEPFCAMMDGRWEEHGWRRREAP
jgi:type VI secretion system protein ImpM